MVDSQGAETETDAVGHAPTGPVRRIRRWETALAVASGILCGSGMLLIGALFLQFFDATFSIWTPAVITDGDIRRYEVTASVCLAALGTSTLLALLSRRWELAWVAGILLVVGIVASLLFAVPQGRWTPVDEPEPLPSNYQPCYSGSNDCVGG